MLEGSQGPDPSTTMAFVKLLTQADEASARSASGLCRSCPMKRALSVWKSMFRQFGIYASQGQLYKPHDADILLYYKESKDGQILEEGITEAGPWPCSRLRVPRMRTTGST